MTQSGRRFLLEPTLADYRRGEELGRGGFGAVCKYKPYRSSPLYAVKVITYDYDNRDIKGWPKNFKYIMQESQESLEFQHVCFSSQSTLIYNANLYL